MKDYYLIEKTHNKRAINKLRTCEVASLIRLYVGSNFDESDVKRYWKYKSKYPSCTIIKRNIRVSNLRWFLNTYTDQIITSIEWHPDFIIGLTKCGTIRGLRGFPSFYWYGNENLIDVFRSCPFIGEIKTKNKGTKHPYIWSKIPALYLKHSEDSIRFMAGVLSTGIIETIDNKKLVKYNKKAMKFIGQWGIPIEYRTPHWAYISPFWVVIVQKWMPEVLVNKWKYVSKAYRAKEYAAILWKIYSNKPFLAKSIPYLVCRRSVFYRYGSIKKLQGLWVENKLVGLDSRYKNIIQEWAK